jgi:hypothetical protein
MSIAKQEFTNAGRAMLGRAQNGEHLTISKIVVGSGSASQPSDLWPLTALVAQEMNCTITTKRDYGNGTLLVEGSLRSDTAPHAFFLKEVGVMAHLGTEADQLYSVANCFAEPPDYIDPASPTIQVFKIKLIIDRIPTANVIVQIGPSEAVTGENQLTDAQGPGVYKETLGNVLHFKRLIAGTRIVLTEDPNSDSITIGIKTLLQNLDLYVPTTYPGIPDPTKLFPTIQAALDSVADVVIPPDKFVTIHVWKGQLAHSVAINVTHPNASQIKIIGQDVIAVAVTGAITVSGTIPNLDMVLNVASIAEIHVNDVVYLHDAPHGQLEVCGVVMSTRPTPTPNITVRFKVITLAPPTIAAQPLTKLLIFPSQLVGSCPDSTYLFNCVTGIGQIKNFGLRSTNTQANGILLGNNGALENVVVCNFYQGIGTNNGKTDLYPVCAANGCTLGISAGPQAGFAVQAPTLWKRMSWSGCSTYGMWLVSGSYIGGSGTGTYILSNATGIRSDDAGFFGNSNYPGTTGGLVCVLNDNGLVASILGVIQCSLTALNQVYGNTTWDCIADRGAQIRIVHNTNVSGRYSPANQVLGPSGGYVDILTP